MRPALGALLAVSLLATGWLALQPSDDDAPALPPAPRAQGPAPRLAAAPPLRAPPTSATSPTSPKSPTSPSLPTSPKSPTLTTSPTSPIPPALPTRPADWPAPSAAALAAWQGAAPAPAAPSAATAATAPASRPAAPFPYQWIGRLDDGGTPQALLSSAQRSVGVRLGDVLDGRWRIDEAADGTLRATVLASGEVLLLRSGAPAAAP